MGEPQWCSLLDEDCLAKVREDPDGYARRVQRHRQGIAKMAALSDYGHYRNPFPARPDRPQVLSARQFSTLLTSQALAFAQGDTGYALDSTCRSVATWRQLSAHSDSLLMTFTGIHVVRESSRLLARMLSELPVDTPLPAACARAFVPPTALETLPCEALRGEFALVTAVGIDSVENMNFVEKMVFSREMTRDRFARYLGAACTEPARRQAAQGTPVTAHLLPSPWSASCVGNFGGCLLTYIAAPAYTGYYHRNQDHAARLQLMATLLWLREQSIPVEASAATIDKLLVARPAALHIPGRAISVVAKGQALALQIPLFARPKGEYWRVPLMTRSPAAPDAGRLR